MDFLDTYLGHAQGEGEEGHTGPHPAQRHGPYAAVGGCGCRGWDAVGVGHVRMRSYLGLWRRREDSEGEEVQGGLGLALGPDAVAMLRVQVRECSDVWVCVGEREEGRLERSRSGRPRSALGPGELFSFLSFPAA